MFSVFRLRLGGFTVGFALLLCGRAQTTDTSELSDRVAGALWGLFMGDALAAPVHWYYGGPSQIRANFGGELLKGYEKAVHPFPQSIMQLSNTGGAGRGSFEGDVIGGVINHGKKQYWQPGANYHYHHTLHAGENTLEASLVRVLMRTIVANGGSFSEDDFRTEYVRFMTTPGTHNDTYASTCHRMFFDKWRAGVPPVDCPDNDGHNVDTVDGLILPLVVALAELGAGRGVESAGKVATRALQVTRGPTKELPEYVNIMAHFLSAVLNGSPLDSATLEIGQAAYGSDVATGVRQRGDTDPIVACYIGGSFPALLHFAYKYASLPVGEALLASANAGGENVHRGAVLGTLAGAAAGKKIEVETLQKGLFNYAELHTEIEAFVRAVVPASRNELRI